MHIADGLLSPITYLPATGLAAVAWWRAWRGLDTSLDDRLIARLATLSALVYVFGLVMLPIVGGTSGHLTGVALLALLFGVRLAFLAYSVVLVLQLFVFGAGGLTALPVNALAIGAAGALTASLVRQVLKHRHEGLAVMLATWCSVMVSATLVGLVLGAQPLLAHTAKGQPLFFPFGWRVVMPALLVPHAVLAVGEAFVTWSVWRYARSRRWALPSGAGTA